jgi:hypothetical protein
MVIGCSQKEQTVFKKFLESVWNGAMKCSLQGQQEVTEGEEDSFWFWVKGQDQIGAYWVMGSKVTDTFHIKVLDLHIMILKRLYM